MRHSMFHVFHHIVDVDLVTKNLCKMDPKCRNLEQNLARIEASRLICARYETDGVFLGRVVTLDVP